MKYARMTALLIGCATLAGALPAAAEPFDLRFRITVGDAMSGGKYVTPLPSPINPVVGVFSFLFDNGASFGSTTAGLTVNSFNLSYPVNYSYFRDNDTLVLGSILNGIGCTANTGSQQFCTSIENVSTAPTLGSFLFAVPGYDGFFYPGTLRGEVVGAAAVPEPSAWAMMMIGLAAIGGLARRRRPGRAALHA